MAGALIFLQNPVIGTLIFFLLRQTLADLGAIYLMILRLVAPPAAFSSFTAERHSCAFMITRPRAWTH
jgi:hypothetical protein